MVFQGDVLDEGQMDQLRNGLLERWGRVDILINAASGNLPGAVIPPDKTILDLNMEDMRKVLELNYLGTVVPTQQLLPVFIKQNAGVIINISSVTAQRPMTRTAGYSAAKAAIDNYTMWLAGELANK